MQEWDVVTYDDFAVIAVIPVDDKYDHLGADMACPCYPVEEHGDNGWRLIIHNAFDFRDIAEWLETGLPMLEDQGDDDG